MKQPYEISICCTPLFDIKLETLLKDPPRIKQHLNRLLILKSLDAHLEVNTLTLSSNSYLKDVHGKGSLNGIE